MRAITSLALIIVLAFAVEHFLFHNGQVHRIPNSTVWPEVCVGQGGIDRVDGIVGEDGVYWVRCKSGWTTNTSIQVK